MNSILSILVPTAFFLLTLLLFWRLHRTQEGLERKWFTVRILPHTRRMTLLFVRSLAVSLLFSLLLSLPGLSVRAGEVWFIYAATLLLGLFSLSFLDLRAGILLLLLLSFPVQMGWIDGVAGVPPQLIQFLQQANLTTYLLLFAAFTLMEALLLRWESLETLQPVHLLGRRGKAIAGYRLQRIWPLPLLILLPSQVGWAVPPFLSWWPPFQQGEGEHFLLFFMPILLAANQIIVRSYPLEKVRRLAWSRAGFGALEAGTAVFSFFMPLYAMLLFLLILFLSFLLRRFHGKREKEGSPYFTNTYQGLSILAVLPGSPAAEMGIEVGDRVTKVNGIPVKDEPSFYAALQKNGAFCKLEVLNREGNLTFPQRSLYLGEHHLLGLVFAPGEKWHDRLPASPWNPVQLFLPLKRKNDPQERGEWASPHEERETIGQ